MVGLEAIRLTKVVKISSMYDCENESRIDLKNETASKNIYFIWAAKNICHTEQYQQLSASSYWLFVDSVSNCCI